MFVASSNGHVHLHARVVWVLGVEVGLEGDGLPVAAGDQGHPALDQHALQRGRVNGWVMDIKGGFYEM